jgi:hypothetical protein
VWLVDDSVLQPLYDRVKHLLPQELGRGALAGINARWRLYRYTPGRVWGCKAMFDIWWRWV